MFFILPLLLGLGPPWEWNGTPAGRNHIGVIIYKYKYILHMIIYKYIFIYKHIQIIYYKVGIIDILKGLYEN